MTTTIIRAPRAIVGGREQSVEVTIEDGVIVEVAPFDSAVEEPPEAASRNPEIITLAHDDALPPGDRVPRDDALPPGDRVPREAGCIEITLAHDEVLIPGLVDTHVHVNEPGRTDWEGFESATRAAAAGGVTTILDMPLNSIPATTTAAALWEKKSEAAGKTYVDVGFWGGAVPGNLGDLEQLDDAGVFGFKCFLLDSGVEEFPPLDADQFREAMTELARLGALMIVHAEAGDLITDCAHGTAYQPFLDSRPTSAEAKAIDLVLETARATGGRAHIVHLSASEAIGALRAARADGVDVSVETCPHYLYFSAEAVPDGATAYKCCPPIRGAENQRALWQGLRDGDIDYVVTDHSPSTLELKCLDTGDFAQAWGGIAGLQLGLAAVWTAARMLDVPLADVVGWMATATADRVGLTDRGRIEVGARADLAVFAPEESFQVDVRTLHHKNPVSPYADHILTGAVRRTYLAGEPIDLDAAPRGELIRRRATSDAVTTS